ncbi:hypothetical protein PhCBS80983_g00351 [Powellomyces hirtus]|uniref:Uncharacterized protein n=1 Tax=Powellomyces hirtus TaxID=109895 RepID=A0A507EHC3_9FUNG|nr:hypothetical protein PhCBS80983_g00351 [Powellomyces hirtus]
MKERVVPDETIPKSTQQNEFDGDSASETSEQEDDAPPKRGQNGSRRQDPCKAPNKLTRAIVKRQTVEIFSQKVVATQNNEYIEDGSHAPCTKHPSAPAPSISSKIIVSDDENIMPTSQSSAATKRPRARITRESKVTSHFKASKVTGASRKILGKSSTPISSGEVENETTSAASKNSSKYTVHALFQEGDGGSQSPGRSFRDRAVFDGSDSDEDVSTLVAGLRV